MSALDSNLSATGYNYDLVSALSQNALNNSLKAFLGNLGSKDLPPITAYYKYNDASHTTGTTLMTHDEVMAMTNGVDVFSIPNGASNLSDPMYAATIKNLADAGFAYAFAAAIGLPPEIPSRNMPDILILNKSNSQNQNQSDPQTVTYHSYYQSFQIMELAYGWNLATVSQITQDTYGSDTDSDGIPDNDPWIFEWEVILNLSAPTTTAFDSLPDEVQQNLENMKFNTNSMFSMQQLYLDLNSPRLIKGASSTVFNFAATDPIYASLNEFISDYWTILRNNGGVIFNTAIKPVSTNDYPPSSIIPTAVNFVVSPYSGGAQNLYTLDYLIMSKNRAMPTIKAFNWDWVNDNSVQGIMSVRRDLFIDYLNKALSPALATITYYPTIDVDMDGRFSVGLNKPSTAPTYHANTNNPVLSFSWDQSAKDDAGLFGAIYHASIETTVSSNVVFSGNTIVCTTILTLYVDIYTALATTKGYALAKQNVTTFTLDSVGTSSSDAGVLSVNSPENSPENTDLVQYDNKDGDYYGGNLKDPSLWSEGVTFGAINDYLKKVDNLESSMNNLMTDFNSEITDICTNCLGWTFPGAGTYQFLNPKFSNHLDLTVQVAEQGY